jgi:hypothetical protein
MTLVVTKTIFKSCKTVIQFFPEKDESQIVTEQKVLIEKHYSKN